MAVESAVSHLPGSRGTCVGDRTGPVHGGGRPAGSELSVDVVKTANDVLAFLLELAAIVALVVWGFTVGANVPARLALGLCSPALLIVGWAVWLAPASQHRLPTPWLVPAKLVVFGLVVAALVGAGHARAGAVFAAVVVLNLALAALWGRL
jgi:uncharacterized protein DUF2568